MKMHDGGLMAFLNPKTQEKAQEGNAAPGKDNIVWIDARELVRNEKNFYGIRDVEELAALIAASGTIEPLTVTPMEDGKYRIVAGERRTAATILRLERGDIIDPKVPCIVKTFTKSGALSPEDMEMLCLIASNRGQRQTRTPLEKLREIEELEPIAQKIFKDEHIQGTFRKFFAEQILSISEAKLQRLKSLAKLVDEARAALEIGMISESAAVELASHSEEEQNDFLQALVDENTQSGVEDIKSFFNKGYIDGPVSKAYKAEKERAEQRQANTDTDVHEEPCQIVTGHESEPELDLNSDTGPDDLVLLDARDIVPGPEPAPDPEPTPASDSKPAEKKSRFENPKPSIRSSETTINIDVPFPDDLSGDKAEREADTWMATILSDSIKIAEAKCEESRATGDKRTAALWDSRRAKAVLVLETVRE